MRSFQQLTYLFILSLLAPFYLNAASYYVDKNATGQNNGTSWTNAWKTFSNINWSSIQPGDVIYISGGADSTVYAEQLSVGKSGTASNPIIITAGKYSPSPLGHQGRVIIEGTGSRSIYVQSKNYVTLKGFECRHSSQGIYIEDNINGVVIDSMYIYDFYGQAGIMLNGDQTTYSVKNVTIINCRIISIGMYAGQTDIIYVQGAQNTVIHDNYLHQRNQDPNAHTDCLQAYHTNGFVIYNNFFINDSVYSPSGGGTPMILGSQGTNPVIIYNNYLYMGGIWYPSGNQNSSLWLRWYDINPMPPTWVINNTIVVNGPRCRAAIEEYYGTLVNNILAMYSNSGGMANLEENLPASIIVDSTKHNLYYRSWGNAGFVGSFAGNGTTINSPSWTQFTTTLGGTGLNTNPNLEDKIGYISDQGTLSPKLRSNSPAIGMGENIEPYLSYFHNTYNIDLPQTDIYGNPRNINNPSIGAYEYYSGSGNNPPYAASNPSPINGATNQPTSLTLLWTCTDPDGDPLTYDVYFGTNNNPPLATSNQSSTNFNPGQLTNSTTYYWKIVAKDNQGHSTSGSLWNFSTQTGVVNNPPNQPSNPNPTNGATNQQLNVTLSWTCTDPDGDALIYDVYFGSNSNPPIVSTNQSSTIFNPEQLNNSTNYYWKVVAKDNQGHSTSGPLWNFTTVTAIVNNPPYPPSNPNPTNGATNRPTNLTVTWSCADPDGDPITYDVYFGNVDEPPLVSTNQSNASFNPGTLNSNTTYYWRIVAKDNQGHSTSGLVWNFSTIFIDQTPPEIVNAELQDSIHLHVWFSEPLEQSSAQNISNYSINNGIQVLSASLSGSEVTLLTTIHTTGVYNLTVVNVKDLAGNQITPPHNIYQYEYSSSLAEGVNFELKIFLDGPYTTNAMKTDLFNKSMIPLTQPYSVSPWNYYGSETVTVIPQNTVDWILLELRTNTSASSVVSRRAVFLRSDGIATDLNGSNKISFPGVQNGSYYVVVYHRNHLAIMTKNVIQLSETSSLYDFTTSQNKAYGNQPMKSLYGGKYGMYAADGNANGNVNTSDYSSIWRPENGTSGYKEGDFDLNGGVNIIDKNAKWKVNKGKISYVPTN